MSEEIRKDKKPDEIKSPERRNPDERNRQEDPQKIQRETERDK